MSIEGFKLLKKASIAKYRTNNKKLIKNIWRQPIFLYS